MLRSSLTMLSKNSSDSCSMDRRNSSSNSGKRSPSGWASVKLRNCSHWPAKFSTSADERGSASIRRAWRRNVSMDRRLPFAAVPKRASSGMLLQRKYERRDANS